MVHVTPGETSGCHSGVTPPDCSAWPASISAVAASHEGVLLGSGKMVNDVYRSVPSDSGSQVQ